MTEQPTPEPIVLLDWTRFGPAEDQHYEVQVTSETVRVMSECCMSSMSAETIVKLHRALLRHPAVVADMQRLADRFNADGP